VSVFLQLSSKEKLYAHHLGVASWAGARIIQAQWTPQAPSLYDLLVLIFTNEEGKCVNFDKLKEDSQSSDEQWKHALSYAAQVFGNLLNYKSFGFTKFVPRIKVNDFKRIVEACPNHEKAKTLWDQVCPVTSSLMNESI
jgi:dipeptidyl-peptidase III